MEKLPEFIANHTLLVAAFLGILGALVWTLIQGTMHGVKRVSPGDATKLINHEDAIVLDVRSDGEFTQGHILNAVHLPAARLREQLKTLEKYRNRPIITTCRTGQQSASAGGVLRKNGFEQVYNLNGGIVAWQNANLPLTKK